MFGCIAEVQKVARNKLVHYLKKKNPAECRIEKEISALNDTNRQNQLERCLSIDILFLATVKLLRGILFCNMAKAFVFFACLIKLI